MGWESLCCLEVAGVGCTAAGLKMGDQGGASCTHIDVTGTSLATSNHWYTGTGNFTSYLKDKNKDEKIFLDFRLNAGGAAQTWLFGLLGLL